MSENKFDVIDFIIRFEGEGINEAEVVEGFQHLINDGTVWGLQGSYGRMARELIDRGFCGRKDEMTPVEAKEKYIELLNESL